MNRVLVDATKPHGKMVVELASLIFSAQTLGKRIEAAVGQMSYGSPTDWVQVAKELGLVDIPGGKTATEQAADIASLLTATNNALGVSILSEYVAKVDQG